MSVTYQVTTRSVSRLQCHAGPLRTIRETASVSWFLLLFDSVHNACCFINQTPSSLFLSDFHFFASQKKMLSLIPVDIFTAVLIPMLNTQQQLDLSCLSRSLRHANDVALYRKAKAAFKWLPLSGDMHSEQNQATIRWLFTQWITPMPPGLSYTDAMYYYAPPAKIIRAWESSDDSRRPGRLYNRRHVIKESLKRFQNIHALRSYKQKRDKNRSSIRCISVLDSCRTFDKNAMRRRRNQPCPIGDNHRYYIWNNWAKDRRNRPMLE